MARRACAREIRASFVCSTENPSTLTRTAASWLIGHCSGITVSQPSRPKRTRSQASSTITFSRPAAASRRWMIVEG
jgi:hypothetical protein